MAGGKQVTPGGVTVLQAKTGMVVAVLFLVFGLVFGVVVMQETPSSESGLRLLQGGFFLIWVVVCVAMIVTYGRVLSRRPGENSLLEITDLPGDSGAAGNFAERLRQLEGLKRDGLISEEEFQAKRAQILGEKW